ncbi:hypothetical protein [Methanococcus maripaludis]|uniref:Uncharacterized protein n=1 Tax=Methanococcus maripaludis TaxID=39152 RepID=A0A7J9PLA7_METMI|nr:hypothetical protein [Methanococcus maripaludis]MBA2864002.1 hypothetical protein [Methanococcus maripaludis]
MSKVDEMGSNILFFVGRSIEAQNLKTQISYLYMAHVFLKKSLPDNDAVEKVYTDLTVIKEGADWDVHEGYLKGIYQLTEQKVFDLKDVYDKYSSQLDFIRYDIMKILLDNGLKEEQVGSFF